MTKSFASTVVSRCVALLVCATPLSAEAESGPAPAPSNDGPSSAAQTAPPSYATYLLGARLTVGMGFGGDTYAAAPLAVSTGNGLSAALGVAVMPLWLRGHGLGLNLSAGYKYEGAQSRSGGTSMERFPLLATVDVLVRIVEKVFIRVASGPELDVGVQVSGTGLYDGMDIALPSALGFVIEGGPAFRSGPLIFDVVFRYTSIEYDGTPDVDGAHVGLSFALQYVLL